MVTSLRFMALTVAGTSYFRLGFEHGGWYWPLVVYAFLEIIALWIECRCVPENGKQHHGGDDSTSKAAFERDPDLRDCDE